MRRGDGSSAFALQNETKEPSPCLQPLTQFFLAANMSLPKKDMKIRPNYSDIYWPLTAYANHDNFLASELYWAIFNPSDLLRIVSWS